MDGKLVAKLKDDKQDLIKSDGVKPQYMGKGDTPEEQRKYIIDLMTKDKANPADYVFTDPPADEPGEPESASAPAPAPQPASTAPQTSGGTITKEIMRWDPYTGHAALDFKRTAQYTSPIGCYLTPGDKNEVSIIAMLENGTFTHQMNNVPAGAKDYSILTMSGEMIPTLDFGLGFEGVKSKLWFKYPVGLIKPKNPRALNQMSGVGFTDFDVEMKPVYDAYQIVVDRIKNDSWRRSLSHTGYVDSVDTLMAIGKKALTSAGNSIDVQIKTLHNWLDELMLIRDDLANEVIFWLFNEIGDNLRPLIGSIKEPAQRRDMAFNNAFAHLLDGLKVNYICPDTHESEGVLVGLNPVRMATMLSDYKEQLEERYFGKIAKYRIKPVGLAFVDAKGEIHEPKPHVVVNARTAKENFYRLTGPFEFPNRTAFRKSMRVFHAATSYMAFWETLFRKLLNVRNGGNHIFSGGPFNTRGEYVPQFWEDGDLNHRVATNVYKGCLGQLRYDIKTSNVVKSKGKPESLDEQQLHSDTLELMTWMSKGGFTHGLPQLMTLKRSDWRLFGMFQYLIFYQWCSAMVIAIASENEAGVPAKAVWEWRTDRAYIDSNAAKHKRALTLETISKERPEEVMTPADLYLLPDANPDYKLKAIEPMMVDADWWDAQKADVKKQSFCLYREIYEYDEWYTSQTSITIEEDGAWPIPIVTINDKKQIEPNWMKVKSDYINVDYDYMKTEDEWRVIYDKADRRWRAIKSKTIFFKADKLVKRENLLLTMKRTTIKDLKYDFKIIHYYRNTLWLCDTYPGNAMQFADVKDIKLQWKKSVFNVDKTLPMQDSIRSNPFLLTHQDGRPLHWTDLRKQDWFLNNPMVMKFNYPLLLNKKEMSRLGVVGSTTTTPAPKSAPKGPAP